MKDKGELLRELRDIAARMNTDIEAAVVEGPSDEKALRLLGFSRAVLKCSGSVNSHHELVDEIARKYTSVVILTDYDKKGKALNWRLFRDLSDRKVRVARSYRDEMGKLLNSSGRRDIESINRLVSAQT